MKRRLADPGVLGVIVLAVGGCAADPGTDGPGRETQAGGAADLTHDRVIGASVRGEAIRARRHGHGPARVLLIGLIHGDEDEGYTRLEETWAAVQAAGLGGLATITCVPTMNPDGFSAQTRGNARGVDLNRNWPARNFTPHRTRGVAPLTEPETRAVYSLLDEPGPDLIIVLHSAWNGPFVNFDGPPMTEALAAAFADAAVATDPAWRLVPDYTNPPGSLGSYAGLDRGIPTLTIEFRRGQDDESARRAATAGIIASVRSLGDADGTRRARRGGERGERQEAGVQGIKAERSLP